MKQKREILIIAGEASGDRHAADLVAELGKLLPEVKFTGIGGDAMAGRGVQLLYHIKQMAFLGFTEVVRHLPFIRRVFRELEAYLDTRQPAAVILVDYPGFNLRLAKLAHRKGIPVIYYISPQLWAWGEKRVEKIRKYVDLLLVIFKFEQDFYARFGIEAIFVGHPLADEIEISLTDKEFRAKHRLDSQKPIVALLPGSRQNEVKSLLPVMLKAYRQFPDAHRLEWVIGKTDTVPSHLYSRYVENRLPIKIISGDTHHLMKYAHLALVASGTATLETGYLKTPMVVLYKVYPLTYWIGKRLVKINNIALANIVCGETVVPELIQNQVTPENIVAEMEKFLGEEDYYRAIREKLSRIKNILGPPGAASRAAREIHRYLKSR